MKLEPKGTKYVLAEEYTYKDLVIPVGTPTDGISYKFRVVALFINKYDPRYIEAVMVHDYLCELEQYKKADKYFEELLPNDALSKVMVSSVKTYHKLRYGV